MSKRTRKALMIPEARVLKYLRHKAGLSMRVRGWNLGFRILIFRRLKMEESLYPLKG